jgi:hypothetical protein
MPTSRPNTSWNSNSDRLKLASARLTARRLEPVSTAIAGPNRSVNDNRDLSPYDSF